MMASVSTMFMRVKALRSLSRGFSGWFGGGRKAEAKNSSGFGIGIKRLVIPFQSDRSPVPHNNLHVVLRFPFPLIAGPKHGILDFLAVDLNLDPSLLHSLELQSMFARIL